LDGFAEQIVGAALEIGLSEEELDALMEQFGATDWVRIAGKAYPPNYAYALGRYRADPAAVQKMREAIASVPRLNPLDYDILFNIEGGDPRFPETPTWDVVKWIRWPEAQGYLPGHGGLICVLEEPSPVYNYLAWRGSNGITDDDFSMMRRNATTMRGGGQAIDKAMMENNLAVQADNQRRRSDEDLDFANYYRNVFKKEAERLT